VWLIGDPRGEIEEWGLTEYLLHEQALNHCATLVDAPNMRVQAWAQRPAEVPRWSFGEGVTLAPMGPAYVQDGTLYAWISYDVAPSVPPHTYSVALHVVGEGGVLAQMDHGLPGVGQHCRFVQTPVEGLPPGDYDLRAAIYNWQNGERLAVDPAADDDYPLLQRVRVE
jgi:hypothetical protein